MSENQWLYRERIITDPQILAGKPVIKGTHIAVELVLEELSYNPDINELLAIHSELTYDDVRACLAYTTNIIKNLEAQIVTPDPIDPDRRP